MKVEKVEKSYGTADELTQASKKKGFVIINKQGTNEFFLIANLGKIDGKPKMEDAPVIEGIAPNRILVKIVPEQEEK